MRSFLTSTMTRSIAVFGACLVLGLACTAEDTLPTTEYQRKYNAELKKLNDRYQDIKQELEEEYAAITHDKDEYCEEISAKVRDLQQRRETRNANLAREAGKLREELTAANLQPNEPGYAQAIAPVGIEGDQLDVAYDRSLATLRQLYQLNAKRNSDLIKLHNARETLEENRFREERELLTQRLRNEARLDNASLTDAEKRAFEMRVNGIKSMEKQSKDRYDNAIAALDEYRSLVNARLDDQTKYLEKQNAIIGDLMDDGITAQRRDSVARELSELNAEKERAERKYQNNVRFIEEKLNLQQQQNRQNSLISREKAALERTWAQTRQQLVDQESALKDQLRMASLTPDQKDLLETQNRAINERIEEQKKVYEQSLKNINERQKIMEKALDDRMDYLKERNNLRLRMAEGSLTRDSYDKYREEISRLEDRRIEQEQAVRTQVMKLRDDMPATFVRTPLAKPNAEARRARMDTMFETRASRIQGLWSQREAGFKNSLDALDQRLAVTDITPEQRRLITAEREEVQKQYDAAKKQYAEAGKGLDQAREAENRRMAERAQYLAKRKQLTDGFNVTNASAEDIRNHERQLREIDAEMMKKDREYRKSIRQTVNSAYRDNDYDWYHMSNWERRVDAPFHREGSVRRELRETRQDAASDVRQAYESAKEAVVDAYHDVVDYLTD